MLTAMKLNDFITYWFKPAAYDVNGYWFMVNGR
jgi:hypothetical protein